VTTFEIPNFIPLLLLVMVVVIVVVVVAATHNPHPPPPPQLSSSALSELDLRYARGEIDRDEYLRRRSDILG
jgi:uncharacterized membrane protein